jgi:hypothetical protein
VLSKDTIFAALYPARGRVIVAIPTRRDGCLISICIAQRFRQKMPKTPCLNPHHWTKEEGAKKKRAIQAGKILFSLSSFLFCPVTKFEPLSSSFDENPRLSAAVPQN